MKTPSIPRSVQIALGVFYLLFALYSIVIVQQLFIGVILPVLLAGLGYVLWRVARLLLLLEDELEERRSGKT